MRAGMLIIVCAVACAAATTAERQKSSTPQESQWVHIDGSKNPELIPEWNAWRTAFRQIATGPHSPKKGRRLIPLELQEVFSEEETLLLIREGDAEMQRFNDLIAQVERLRDRKESLEALRKLNDEIDMEFRWQTLHARDRVLVALTDAARVALRQYVESLKSGTSVSVPKKDLERFRLPQ